MTKKDDAKGASLLDKRATGGDVAEGGFAFQDGLIVARVPSWLADDGFTQMIREALGDAEASFFEPGFGLRREFVEYKNHNLPPGEFWPEVERFREMDTKASGAYRRFVLACKSVSADVQPMVTALRRVRDAFPFFDGALPIQDQSFKDFETTVEKALDKWGKRPESWTSQNIAEFLFRAVVFEVDVPDAENLTRELYRASFEEAFPVVKKASGAQLEASQRAVVELLKSRKNKPILRRELEDRVWAGMSSHGGPSSTVRLFTQHDASVTPLRGELLLDLVRFSGTSDNTYPASDEWDQDVVSKLVDTRCWILNHERPRRIRLSGSRRLSASVAIGAAFPAVSGFHVDLDYRGDTWSTDSHPSDDTTPYPWSVTQPGSEAADLVVAIGVIRDVEADVMAFACNESIGGGTALSLHGTEAFVSAAQVNLAVREAKNAIGDALAATKARKLHLFIAGPAPLALFLGHRLNATSKIICYEHVGERSYQPTVALNSR